MTLTKFPTCPFVHNVLFFFISPCMDILSDHMISCVTEPLAYTEKYVCEESLHVCLQRNVSASAALP